MKIITLASVVFCAATFSPFSFGQAQQPTALDVAELLIQGASADEIFSRAVGANIRVEPEYLGVRFYNTDSNTELADDEIGALMGPVRQDGAYQVIAMALALSGYRLGFSQSQLERLVDAAFIASMRRPPAHISIEFYDTRVGPAGEGGGPSGRVPDTLYSEAQVKATEPESDPFKQAIEKSRQLVTSLMPATDAEFLQLLGALGVQSERRDGHVALPAMAAARSTEGLEQILVAKRTELEAQFDVQFIEQIDGRIVEPEPGVYLMIQVGYYLGQKERLAELEREMDAVFYP